MTLKEQTEDYAGKLEELLVYRSESGAFDPASSYFADIVKKIKEAREKLSADMVPDAREILLLATHDYNVRIVAKGFVWRALHVWAFIPYNYYACMVTLFLFLEINHKEYLDGNSLGLIPLQIFMYGFLGGLIRGIWWITKKVQTRTFRPQFLFPYVSGPWMGALLSLFIYAILRAGLFIVTTGAGEDLKLTDKDDLGIVALMILAGFSWEWVMEIIAGVRGRNRGGS